MPIDRYFKLYLNAGRSIPLVINANQYDSGETWYFTLYTDRGEVYLPSSGAIIGIKADGHIIDNAATVDSRGRVVVTETEQMTAAPGKSVFELSIDGNTHGTANFMLLVEPKPSDGGVLSDSDLSLLQEAIDSTSPAAIAEGVSDWMDEHLTPTTPVVDDTLTVQGAAADAKKTGDEIADLKSALTNSMPMEVKQALNTILQHVAFKDDGEYRDELTTFNTWATSVTLLSISAVYTQSGTVFDIDSLDSLRDDLVVTASYSDGTTTTVTAYTLSGELTAGTSTIAVAYGGKTTSFNVTVTEAFPSGYDWLYDSESGNTLTSYSAYVADASTQPSGTTVSESIVNSLLHVYSSAPSRETNVYKRWNLVDQSTTNGKLIALVRFNSLQSDDATGFRLQLSNGTNGAQLFVQSVDTAYTGIQVTHNEGTTKVTQALTNANKDDFHVVTLELKDGKQIGTFDGVEVFNTSTLSTSYATRNSIFVQSSMDTYGANGVNVDFKKIAYYEA